GIRATTRAPRGSAPALVAVAWPLLAITVRGAEPPDVALTRVSVFDAKLLTHKEPSAVATAKAGEPVAGAAIRIRGPAALPVRMSIRRSVPAAASPTTMYRPTLRTERGRQPTGSDLTMRYR